MKRVHLLLISLLISAVNSLKSSLRCLGCSHTSSYVREEEPGSLSGSGLYTLLDWFPSTSGPLEFHWMCVHCSTAPVWFCSVVVFRQRHQLPGESVHQYVSNLRCLASHCKFAALTKEMIRDQLIEHTTFPKVRETLLLESDDQFGGTRHSPSPSHASHKRTRAASASKAAFLR